MPLKNFQPNFISFPLFSLHSLALLSRSLSPNQLLKKSRSDIVTPTKSTAWLNDIDYDQNERSLLISQRSLERTFGTSSVFEGVPESADPSTLIKEAIHVISCGYEQKTSWGREIGWIYGSVTEDILTGFKMHCREWRSIYCMPLRPAFKGSVPLNLSDRLHQVLWEAFGSVEIFLGRHCPLWYSYAAGRLKWLQRLAYISTVVYHLHPSLL